jgi:hypothetical protein
MGDDVVPLLIRRLQSPGARPVWLSLLGSIMGAPPAFGEQTIAESAEAWTLWGKRAGYMNRRRHLTSVV